MGIVCIIETPKLSWIVACLYQEVFIATEMKMKSQGSKSLENPTLLVN